MDGVRYWLAAGREVRWAVVIAGLLVALLGGGCNLERAYWSPGLEEMATPAGAMDVRVELEGGGWVSGWFIPADAVAKGQRDVAPLVIFCHGRATGIDALTPYVLPAARDAGASLLMFSYRGFGESSPLDGVSRASVVADTRAVVRHALSMQRVDSGAVFVMGYSLGAVPALAAAADEPRVAGVVVGGGYGLASEALEDRGRGWASWLIGSAYDPAASAARLGDRPLYVFHGGADSAVGPYHAYTVARSGAKGGAQVTVDVVPGASHYSVITDGGALMARIGAWVRSSITARATPDLQR